MKKSKKLISLVVAAVMALGIVMAPICAVAKDSVTIGPADLGIFKINSVKGKTIRMIGNRPKAKTIKKTLVIKATYKLDSRYYPVFRQDNYTVTRICKNAFKGVKATKIKLPSTIKQIDKGAFNKTKAKKTLTIVIKSKKLKRAKVTGMLKGAPAKKVIIKVPKAKLKAYKKFMTKSILGAKGSVVVKGF